MNDSQHSYPLTPPLHVFSLSLSDDLVLPCLQPFQSGIHDLGRQTCLAFDSFNIQDFHQSGVVWPLTSPYQGGQSRALSLFGTHGEIRISVLGIGPECRGSQQTALMLSVCPVVYEASKKEYDTFSPAFHIMFWIVVQCVKLVAFCIS